MKTYVALLRAVNVGGSGKLSMAELRARCEACGYQDVQTLQVAGNVVLRSGEAPAEVQKRLTAALAPFEVLLRTAAEMAQVLQANPFAQHEGNRVMAIFLHAPPPPDLPTRGQVDEQVAAGQREIYVYHPHGQGRSKLVIPAAKHGTARNMNTIAKLVALC